MSEEKIPAVIGQVIEQGIAESTTYSFLSYANYALANAYIGLKSVHKRILYAMHAFGLRPNGPYKRSTKTVGKVFGRYQTHSDDLFIASRIGQLIRIPVSDIRMFGRAAAGVQSIALKNDDIV